jgi:hypothetical protein
MAKDKEFIKRTTYVIDKKFQFRFVATFLLYIILSLVIFTAGVTVLYWARYMAGDMVFSEIFLVSKQVPRLDTDGKPMKNPDGSLVTEAQTIPQEMNRMEIVVPPILLNNLIIMLIISILGIFYSHRIAGPVYRIDKDIEKALAGEKGIKIRLRKGDKLQELAEKVNKLIEAYDKK